MNLSKSRYLIGLQCSKRLWWTVNEPDAPELAVETNTVALDRGRQLGELARAHVPGGVLIDMPPWEIDSRVAATAKALSDGASVIYEASFRAGGGFASVDILERKGRGFVLTEAKSTLGVKAEHLPDVALQWHVLSAAGLDVKQVEVMHLNRECRHPDLSHLFVRERVTADVLPLLPEVPAKLAELHQALAGSVPEVEPGPHCDDPYPCPFRGRCWPEQPAHHVSTIYRIRAKKVAKLVGEGVETIHDLPDDYKATPTVKRQLQSVRAGRVIVDPGLGKTLAKIKEPIAFLDFETIIPAVPAWPGCGPYNQVPVLPALVPGLGYDDLDVKDGGTASALLEALLLGGEAIPAAEHPEVRRRLLAYCERDTLAMVRLYERLLVLADRPTESAG